MSPIESGTVVVRRIENGAAAIAIAAGFVMIGYDWWWLAALFLVPDLSALGYAWGPRVGAAFYNAGHSYAGPLVLLAVHAVAHGASERSVAEPSAWIFAAAIWAFHVAVDRALGYGLKHVTGFKQTDLGGL